MSVPGTPVPAVGGTRQVPAPDPIAEDYLLLGLRLDQRIPGLVDGYFGPAELKARVDMEQFSAATRLRDDAAAAGGTDRRRRSRSPSVAIGSSRRSGRSRRTRRRSPASRCRTSTMSRCVSASTPPRHDDDGFREALAAVDALLPGEGPRARTAGGVGPDASRSRSIGCPTSSTGSSRGSATARRRDFGLPDGEDLRVSLVTGQPWSGYNWYDGGRRSRVDVNTDLPVRAPDLITLIAHETYPGHHLEHVWKEADLVDGQGRLESSMLLINTPECPISEGLADLGPSFAAPLDERADLLLELFERAGLAVSADPREAQETAERAVALEGPRHRLAASRGNAALMRHADGASHDEVLAYLQDVGGYTPKVAAKLLEFIEHPLWRTYVFVYTEGEALVRRWVEAAPEPERIARFGRLLHEQITPGRLLAELG